MMDRMVVNPWKWQDEHGYVQANVVVAAQRTAYCAGQTSVDADGRPVHAGDMGAQMGKALDNLETVLAGAGLALRDVVRLTYFTTDLDAFFASYGVLVERLARAGCRPAGSLLEVKRLAFPELLVEIEATAAG